MFSLLKLHFHSNFVATNRMEGQSKESHVTFSLSVPHWCLQGSFSELYIHLASRVVQTVPLPSGFFSESWETHRSKVVLLSGHPCYCKPHGPWRGESSRTKKLFMLSSILKHTHHMGVQCEETSWSTIISEKGLEAGPWPLLSHYRLP